MEKYSSFVALLCMLLMHSAPGYPYGDVSIDCDSMLPNQGSPPQRSTPPFVITVSFDRYDPGNIIQVVLEGTSPSGFKAFMVQAREVNGNVPVGMFLINDPNSLGLPCANFSNSAVSHSNLIVKHRITASWVAPPNTKKIWLVATFVQDSDIYWVGVHSKTLSPRYSDTTNNSTIVDDSETANSSDLANDLSNEDNDFNTLLAETEADYESETPVDSEPIHKNVAGKSKRKTVLSMNVNCAEGEVPHSSSSGCMKSTQGSSQSSGSKAKIIVKEGIVVQQGGTSGSGCAGGGVASVYNQYGCRDSISSNTDSKVKVVTYPESNPFPPERESYSSKIADSTYGGIIYSQGSKPPSGSAESIHITVQSGQGSPACDKSSSSYNIQTCNQLGQSSDSQGSSSFGTQGSTSQSGSSETVRITVQGQPSGATQSGTSSGAQQGGSYSSGSSSCGQGTTYDSNPCNQGQVSSYNNQASSQSQGNSNTCRLSYKDNRC